MSFVTTTQPTPTPAKTRGSNRTPPQRVHKAAPNRARLMKKAVEQYKGLTGRALTASDRSMLAYFTFPMSRGY